MWLLGKYRVARDRGSELRQGMMSSHLWVRVKHVFSSLVVLVAAGALMLLMLWLQSKLPGPVTHADEGSYLIGAAGLAGVLETTPVIGYHFGYSLLLVPAFLFTESVEAYYQSALATNAVLALVFFFACVRIFYLILPEGTKPIHRAGCALLACLQTSYFPYTLQSLSDGALVVFLVLAVYFTIEFDRTRRVHWLVWLTLALSALYPIHPRGLIYALPLVGVITWQSGFKFWPRVCVIIPLVAFALGFGMNELLDTIANRIPGTAPGYDISRSLHGLLHAQGWELILSIASGVIITGLASTLLLPVPAVVHALKKLRQLAIQEKLLLAMTIGLFLIAIVTGVFFSGTESITSDPFRSDLFVYQRYAAPVLSIIFILSIPYAFKLARGTSTSAFVSLLIFVAVYAWLAHRFSGSLGLPFNKTNVPLLAALSPDGPGFAIRHIGATLAFVLSVAIIVAGYRRHWIMWTYATLVFVATNILFVTRYLEPQSQHSDNGRAAVRYLAILASNLSGSTCIDVGRVDGWAYIDYNLYLMQWLPYSVKEECRRHFHIERSDEAIHHMVEAMPVNDSISVFADPVTHSQLEDYGLVVSENWADDRLALSGARIRILGSSVSGEEMQVQMINAGRTVWPVFRGRDAKSVKIGIIYKLADGERIEGRVELRRPVFPNETLEARVPLDMNLLRKSGEVCVGLLQEKVAWADASSGGLQCISIR